MKTRTSLTRISILSLLVLMMLALAPAAQAFDGRGGDRVVVPADEVINDDLYIGGDDVVIDGTIKGDLIAGGQIIRINGTVEGDLIAAGQRIIINGTVTDDVRAAAYALEIGPAAKIGDDFISVGYSADLQDGSAVDGSFVFAGFQALIGGEVAENAQVAANGLLISGKVAGDVMAEVGDPNDVNFTSMRFNSQMPPVPFVRGGLKLEDSAQIGGDLNYTSKSAASVPARIVAGQTQFTELVQDKVAQEVAPQNQTLNWFLDSLRRMLGLIVVGLLLVWLAPAWIVRPANKLQERPLQSLGWGTLVLFLFPALVFALLIAVIVLMVLMGALTLGNLVGVIGALGGASLISLVVAFVLIVSYLTYVVVGYLGGRYLLSKVNPQMAEKPVWAMLIGVILLAILLSIPVAGWLIGLFVVLFGLGAIWLLWMRRPRSPETTVVSTPA